MSLSDVWTVHSLYKSASSLFSHHLQYVSHALSFCLPSLHGKVGISFVHLTIHGWQRHHPLSTFILLYVVANGSKMTWEHYTAYGISLSLALAVRHSLTVFLLTLDKERPLVVVVVKKANNFKSNLDFKLWKKCVYFRPSCCWDLNRCISPKDPVESKK